MELEGRTHRPHNRSDCLIHPRLFPNRLAILARDDPPLKVVGRRRLQSIDMTSYKFDKILWLIGSGRFYRIVIDGYELRIGQQCDAFLEHMKTVPWLDRQRPGELIGASQ